MAPSHRTADLCSRDKKSALISFENTGWTALLHHLDGTRSSRGRVALCSKFKLSSAIIHLFASNSPSFTRFGVPGLKTVGVSVLLLASASLVSCGSYSRPSSSTSNTTGAKLRAFITNPLAPAGVGTTPIIDVVDALKDKLAGAIARILRPVEQEGKP